MCVFFVLARDGGKERNGKVYVSLSQNLLFASGSTTIDKKGIDAIKKLAQVLNDNPDIDIPTTGDQSTNYAYSLPQEDGLPDQILQTDGNGQGICLWSRQS